MSIKIINIHGVYILNYQTTILAIKKKQKKFKKEKIKHAKMFFFPFQIDKIEDIEK